MKKTIILTKSKSFNVFFIGFKISYILNQTIYTILEYNFLSLFFISMRYFMALKDHMSISEMSLQLLVEKFMIHAKALFLLRLFGIYLLLFDAIILQYRGTIL